MRGGLSAYRAAQGEPDVVTGSIDAIGTRANGGRPMTDDRMPW